MQYNFTPAKKDKISTVIIKQIRAAILQGKLKPGELLPPEKELIVQFGVSKHTLREALRALEGMGLIAIRRGAGGGPMVREMDLETARESFANFLHFHDVSTSNISEIRMLIEPYLARQAAENFSPEALEELRQTHERCKDLLRHGKSLVGAEAEIMFHVLLGKHAGNPVIWSVLDFCNNLLVDVKRRLKPGAEFSEQVLAAHQKIIDAIADKRADDAELFMREHIREVEMGLKSLEG